MTSSNTQEQESAAKIVWALCFEKNSRQKVFLFHYHLCIHGFLVESTHMIVCVCLVDAETCCFSNMDVVRLQVLEHAACVAAVEQLCNSAEPKVVKAARGAIWELRGEETHQQPTAPGKASQND